MLREAPAPLGFPVEPFCRFHFGISLGLGSRVEGLGV